MNLYLRVVEAKGSLALVVRNSPSDLQDVSVESTAEVVPRKSDQVLPQLDMKACSPDVIEIGEDKGLLQVEATGDNVFGVFVSELVNLVQLELGLHQELLVV